MAVLMPAPPTNAVELAPPADDVPPVTIAVVVETFALEPPLELAVTDAPPVAVAPPLPLAPP
jgi:hypothetical protein